VPFQHLSPARLRRRICRIADASRWSRPLFLGRHLDFRRLWFWSRSCWRGGRWSFDGLCRRCSSCLWGRSGLAPGLLSFLNWIALLHIFTLQASLCVLHELVQGHVVDLDYLVPHTQGCHRTTVPFCLRCPRRGPRRASSMKFDGAIADRERSDLSAVLDQLDLDALPDCRVGLLRLNTDLLQDHSFRLG